MQRIANYGKAIIAVVLVTISAGTVEAGWHEFWGNVSQGYARNNAWPDPFNEIDAMQVVAPFEVMKRNGWRLNNTIGNDLFRASDNALEVAGNHRVRWIATQAPMHRRSVYVLRGSTQEETDARVASVRRSLASYVTNGQIPPVYVTDREPSSANGARATQITRQALEEMPAPKLPSTSAQGTAAAAQ